MKIQPNLIPGVGAVQLAQANDKKAMIETAKANLTTKKDAKMAASQAYAEAEVAHATMVHAKDVDPDKLAESREKLDTCYASFMLAKKEAVKAEADMYAAEGSENPFTKDSKKEGDDEGKDDKGEEEDAEAKKAKAAEAEATAKAEADAKAAEATATAAAAEEAAKLAAANAPAAVTVTVESLQADLAAANAKTADLEAKLATASEAAAPAPAAKPAEAAPAASPAPQGGAAAQPRLMRDVATASATVSFDHKAGKPKIVIASRVPLGEQIATASEDGVKKAADLTGLFNRADRR